ncbi:MAG: hypothetical protein SFV81_12990 [Pirellulaceae bacterium]|nr:hypothetical protein [Pirellulaceae bacterium]
MLTGEFPLRLRYFPFASPEIGEIDDDWPRELPEGSQSFHSVDLILSTWAGSEKPSGWGAQTRIFELPSQWIGCNDPIIDELSRDHFGAEPKFLAKRTDRFFSRELQSLGKSAPKDFVSA